MCHNLLSEPYYLRIFFKIPTKLVNYFETKQMVDWFSGSIQKTGTQNSNLIYTTTEQYFLIQKSAQYTIQRVNCGLGYGDILLNRDYLQVQT